MPLDFAAQACRLAVELRRGPPDVVFAHGENALLFAPLCRRAGTLLCVVFHALRLPPRSAIGTGSHNPRGVLADIDHHMLRSVISQSDAVIAFSDHSRSVVAGALGPRTPPILRVRPGLDAIWTAPAPAVPGPPGRLRLLHWGRLVPVKGVSDLLTAVGLLAAEFDVELDVYGTGPQEPVLRATAESLPSRARVTFHGVATGAEIRAACARADLAVFPTLDESYGIAIAEALAAGIPLVATTAGAVPELLGHGRFGTLVEPGRPEALARAVADTYRHPEGAARRAAAAREHARAWTWDAAAEASLRALDRVEPT